MMKAVDIKVKMDAAYAKYEKRLASTKRFEDRAAKYWNQIVTNGWDKYLDKNGNFNAWEVARIVDNPKAFDIIYGWETAVNDAKNSKEKEPEVLAVYEGWVKKYNDALKYEGEVDNFPEIFKQVIDMLVTEWTEWDKGSRIRMQKLKDELRKYNPNGTPEERAEYKEQYRIFISVYPLSRQMVLKKSDEELFEMNKSSATDYVKDLIHRIKNKVGEITNLNNIRFVGKALNGTVDGTLGSVRLETITAGGYNVQRLHYRVLVHNI